MKRSIIACILAVLVVACCPCRKLNVTGTRDSVSVTTAVRTEYVVDTVQIEIPVEKERQTVRDTMSHLETSFAVSDARINKDGSLFHSLENKAQKRPVATQKEIVYRDSIVYRDRAVTQTLEVNKLRWWQKALCWIGGVALSIGLVWGAFKIGRRFV